MGSGSLPKIVEQLRGAVQRQEARHTSDGRLLELFITQRDETAFEALVQRHGPMVMGVCRRVLQNPHDADDAFQATFLVLVRKASSVRPREMVGNWLYGVAYRTALEARRQASRRRAKERHVIDKCQPQAGSEWSEELRTLLDQEMTRLPGKYRSVLVLCDLEGKTRKEVAQQLAIPEGTVASRLATARKMLAKRLARGGLAVSAGTLATVLSHNAATADVPASAVAGTIKAARVLAAGQAASTIPPNVASLTEGVLKAVFLKRLKTATIVTLLGTMTLTGGAMLARGERGGVSQSAVSVEQPPTRRQEAETNKSVSAQPNTKVEPRRERHSEKNWYIPCLVGVGTYVDLKQRTVNFMSPIEGTGGGMRAQIAMTLEVDPTARITVDGKPATLADLKTDNSVLVNFEYEAFLDRGVMRSRLISIEAVGSDVEALLRAVDPKRRTVTVQREKEGALKETVYPIAPDAAIIINNKKRRLADLRPKMQVSLHMSAVKPLVVGVTAAGPKVQGVLTAVQSLEHAISLNIDNTHLRAVRVPVAPDAPVIIGGRQGRLADLQVGQQVIVHMSAESDQSLIIAISTVSQAGR